MSIIEAIILGLIQGLTEFLPVSSSGHIELGQALLGAESSHDLAFSVLLHGATVLSIMVVFWKDLWYLTKQLFSFQWNEDTQYIAKLVLSMLPVGVIAVLFKDQIEALFSGQILLVGICLLCTGGILRLTKLERPNPREVNFKDAMIIGLMQAIAILPGISRSGTTISTALALGVSREKATRFSFLMILAPIIGATLLECKDLLEVPVQQSGELLPFTAGFIAAFLSGLFACRWMIKLVNTGQIIYFSFYCFIVGAIAILFGLFG